MQSDILFVASQSKGRQELLSLARIPFTILSHGSDEEIERGAMPFSDYVLLIAQHKMATLTLPTMAQVNKNYLFVLTADTLVRNPRTDMVLSKPVNRHDAERMLSIEREGPVEVVTACCLEKYIYEDGWHKQAFKHWTNSSLIEFYVDEESVEQYFNLMPMALQCSGAGVVEDFGLSFVKSIQGSYSAVTGLPLYELRMALKQLGFLFHY